jgi:hypothetical protein
VPPAIRAAQQHFDQIWAVDGSTLEALFRKLKVLEDVGVVSEVEDSTFTI